MGSRLTECAYAAAARRTVRTRFRRRRVTIARYSAAAFKARRFPP